MPRKPKDNPWKAVLAGDKWVAGRVGHIAVWCETKRVAEWMANRMNHYMAMAEEIRRLKARVKELEGGE